MKNATIMDNLYQYNDTYFFKAIIKIANILFERCFFLYKLLYFSYKNYTEREKIKFLYKNIKNGMTVIDIGANIGFYTVLLSKLVGKNGSVHVFEPDKLNYKYLMLNTRKLKNVHLNNYAVGIHNEKIYLYKSDELNTRHQTFSNGKNNNYTEIDCIKIDDYFKNFEKIDFVKIDTEGYSHYVLSGMIETIKRSDRIIILDEFWPYEIKESGINPEDYLTMFKYLGFNIIFFDSKYTTDKIINTNKKFLISFYAMKLM